MSHTWYSKERADAVFATKGDLRGVVPDLSSFATKKEVADGDTALGERINNVANSAASKNDLASYLKTEDAANTYATKEALAQAQLGGGKAPDLSSYLTRADAASTYATKRDLAGVQAGGPPLAALPLRPGQSIPTVGFFGDSWSTEATMGQGFNLPSTVSRALGCIPVASAVDGSGFTYSASGHDGFETDARVNAVCAAAPNLIVTIGSLNSDKVIDNGDAEGTKIKDAVQQFVTKVRARLPQVPIVMIGPEPSSVTRLQSKAAHVNARAQKEGVEAAGGIANGVAFIDWLGVADKQAVPWRDGRVCATGDVVVWGGVAYRVTAPWAPAAGATPASAGAPTVQVSDTLSGTGNSGAPKGDGTRDSLLLSDDTHPTKLGAVAFGAAAAKHITDAVASLATWAKGKGPVIPAPQAGPPAPPPAQGDALPVMAWLPRGWGYPTRNVYSSADLSAIAALKPDQVALPIQNTTDAADAAVAIPPSAKDNTQTLRQFSDNTVAGLRVIGIDAAGMVEAIDMFEAAGVEVLPNVRNGLLDSAAEYYQSSDGKLHTLLGKRVGKTYQTVHGRGQAKLNGILKKDYPAFVRVVDAADATADWMLTDPVKDAQKGVLSASLAGAGVWGAAKDIFPDGVWVLVESKDEQAAAKAAAKTAGVTIVGWAVSTAEALAAIKG